MFSRRCFQLAEDALAGFQWPAASPDRAALKGPLRVKMRRTQSEQSQSALLHQADLNERCRHFADGPLPDSCIAAIIPAVRRA